MSQTSSERVPPLEAVVGPRPVTEGLYESNPHTTLVAVTLRVLPRVVGDMLAVAVGLLVFAYSGHRVLAPQVAWAIGFIVFAAIVDAIHNRVEWNYVEEFAVALKTGFWALLLTATGSFLLDRQLSRVFFLSVILAMIILKPLTAFIADRLIHKQRHETTTVLVICGDDEYRELLNAAIERSGPSLRIARLWDQDSEPPSGQFVGNPRNLLQVCWEIRPRRVIFGESHTSDPHLLLQIAEVNEMGIPVRSFSRSFAEEFGRVPIASLDTSWFLFDIAPLHRLGYRMGRRLVDIVGGLVAATVMASLLPFIALAVILESTGPIFYVQDRVGEGGRPFKMYKIRTMRSDAESDGPSFAQVGDARVTRVGRFLRRTRLDELPQALNLLRGDMTLVGPRPERPKWVEEFREAIPYYDKRHLVKPGLTGWAQVHEGYGSSVAATIRKLERDLYYLRYRSLGLDLRILMSTAARIFTLSGR